MLCLISPRECGIQDWPRNKGNCVVHILNKYTVNEGVQHLLASVQTKAVVRKAACMESRF